MKLGPVLNVGLLGFPIYLPNHQLTTIVIALMVKNPTGSLQINKLLTDLYVSLFSGNPLARPQLHFSS